MYFNVHYALHRCSAMLEVELDAIYQLAYTAWQWIAWHLSTTSGTSSIGYSRGDTTGQAMETVHTCAQVLRDFAEFQLGKLSSATATGVGAKHDRRTQVVHGYYYAVVLLLQAYAEHLRVFATSDILVAPAAASSAGTEMVQEIWEKHVLLIVELVTQISEKDFFIAESKTDTTTTSIIGNSSMISSASGEYLQDLASVLCLGLETVNGLLSIPLLRSYPALCASYMSCLAYLCGGEVDGLVRWFATRGHLVLGAPSTTSSTTITTITTTNQMENVLWQLYDITGHREVALARQAYQSLQNVLQQQLRLLQNYTSSDTTTTTMTTMMLIQPAHRVLWQGLLYEMTRSLLFSGGSGGAHKGTAATSSGTGGIGRSETGDVAYYVVQADRIDAFASCYWSLLVFVGYMEAYYPLASDGSVTTSSSRTTTMMTTTMTVDDWRVLQSAVQSILNQPLYSPFHRTHLLLDPFAGAMVPVCSFTPMKQTAIWTLLRQLVTDRQLSLTAVDRRTRAAFIQNVRDFLRQLRSLASS